MQSRSGRAATAALLAGLVTLGMAAPDAAASGLGVTSIGFEQSVLDDLGIGVAYQATAIPLQPGQMGFAVAASSDLSFAAPGGDFEGFSGGVLRHRGELTLFIAGRAYALSDFELRVAADPLDLALFDSKGRRWFLLEASQPLAVNGDLHVRNIDVNMAPELAALLARPELSGSYLGQADLFLPGASRSALKLPSQAVARLGAGPCDEIFNDDRDVSLIDLGGVTQLAREAGGRIALSFSAKLRNTGTSAVLWKRSIEPDGPPENVGEHPFLALHVFRILDGGIKQIGRSDVKHAFFSANTGCPCAGGQIIYPNCEDTYGSSTNSNRTYLAPREEVTAGSGAWSRLGSHFDATPVDDFRDHGGNSEHDDFEHRLIVAESDLQTGGDYFVEAWYIISGDVDLFNSMGHDEVSPSFAGSSWSFATLGELVPGSILDEFVDPVAPPPGSANGVLDTGEGRLQLAVSTTDLGGGDFHYEFALMNYDFDRQIRSFSVPLLPGLSVSNVDSTDGDGDAGNDWAATVTASAISWQAPEGNEMDWGRLYSFGFDVDAGPVVTTVGLGVLEPGTPSTLSFGTLGPVGVPEVPLQGPAARFVLLGILSACGAALAARRSPRRRAGLSAPPARSPAARPGGG